MNEQQSLVSLINQRLESGDVELPVFDNIAVRIHREVRENKLDADGLCTILEEDPILVSEVLRTANSSFFSGLVEVRDLRGAAVRLGIKQIASIVFSVSQKRMYSASRGPFKARLLQLWQHASAVSLGSRWLANNAGFRSIADEAFVAGLLHDVGKLSLLRIIEELAKTDNIALSNDLVNDTVKQLYCSHGARLLEMWNLPESFKTVVLHQDDEHFDDSNVTLCIVRLVDKACALEGISDQPGDGIVLESLPESLALGLSEIDLAELRIVIEDCKGLKKAA